MSWMNAPTEELFLEHEAFERIASEDNASMEDGDFESWDDVRQIIFERTGIDYRDYDKRGI